MTVRDGRNECKAAKRSKQEARGKRDYSRAADEALSGIESVLRVGHRLDNVRARISLCSRPARQSYRRYLCAMQFGTMIRTRRLRPTWRLAGVPTSMEPSSPKATTEGVVLAPSEFSITRASIFPSMIATQEFVVPRSTPITSPEPADPDLMDHHVSSLVARHAGADTQIRNNALDKLTSIF